jgi:hypothetical protein
MGISKFYTGSAVRTMILTRRVVLVTQTTSWRHIELCELTRGIVTG